MSPVMAILMTLMVTQVVIYFEILNYNQIWHKFVMLILKLAHIKQTKKLNITKNKDKTVAQHKTFSIVHLMY